MGMDSVFRLSVVMGMQDNLTAPLSGVTDSVTNTTKKLDDAFGTVQKAGAALAGVGAGITTACIATVFIHNEMDQDEDKSRGSVGSVISALTRKETRTLESKEKVTERDIQELKSGNGKGNTIIQKLEIRVDVEKIKDLPMLFKLIDEIKDAQNSTDEPVTA